MTKLLIIGASGGIASQVIRELQDVEDVRLTLFVRNRRGLNGGERTSIIEGDALHIDDVRKAVSDQDIVYGNLAGDLGQMARNIVTAMDENSVKRLIFISSIGIYEAPLRPVLRPYKEAADVIESSDLDYTVLRPAWFTSDQEVDYEITRKGEPERGSVISRKSLATLIAKIVFEPDMYVRESIGINKPNS